MTTVRSRVHLMSVRVPGVCKAELSSLRAVPTQFLICDHMLTWSYRSYEFHLWRERLCPLYLPTRAVSASRGAVRHVPSRSACFSTWCFQETGIGSSMYAYMYTQCRGVLEDQLTTQMPLAAQQGQSPSMVSTVPHVPMARDPTRRGVLLLHEHTARHVLRVSHVYVCTNRIRELGYSQPRESRESASSEAGELTASMSSPDDHWPLQAHTRTLKPLGSVRPARSTLVHPAGPLYAPLVARALHKAQRVGESS
jgi:hypothetical protein